MAYKFQLGAARLSGSTTFEEALVGESTISASAALQGASLAADGAAVLGGSLTAVGVVAGGAISSATSIDGSGDLTMGTITMTGFAVDADGDTNLKSLRVDDNSYVGSDSVTDLIQLQSDGDIIIKDGAYDFDIASHDGTNGLLLGGVLVNASAADLNFTNVAAAGTAEASKAVVLDASKNIATLGTVGCGAITSTGASSLGSISSVGAVTSTAAITAGTSFIIGSADLNEADMEKLDGITNGTAAAAKAVVLDASKNIATLGTVGCGAITSTGASSFGSISSVGAITATGVLSSSANISGSIFYGNGSGLTNISSDSVDVDDSSANSEFRLVGVAASGDGVTLVTMDTAADLITMNASTGKLTLAGPGIAIGSADITEAEFEFLDGATAGTAVASKALVLDASKNVATLGTVGCGAITSTGASSFGASTLVSLDNSAGGITNAGAVSGVSTLGVSAVASMASIQMDDGSTLGPDSVTDLWTFNGDGDTTQKNGAYDFDLASHDGTNGLKLGGVLVNASAADLNFTNVAAAGTAEASKAVVLDASKDIAGLNDVSAAGLTLSDLTDNRLPLVGASGLLQDNAAFTYVDSRAALFGYVALAVSSSASGSAYLADGLLSINDKSGDEILTVSNDGADFEVDVGVGGNVTATNFKTTDVTYSDSGITMDADGGHFTIKQDDVDKSIRIVLGATDAGTSGFGIRQADNTQIWGVMDTGAVSGSGALQVGGNVTMAGLGTATVALATDLMIINDGAGGVIKNTSLANYATALAAGANEGLASTAGRLELDLNDLAAAAVSVANDSIAIIDADGSNGSKKESIADLVTAMAGTGITATNGVLSVSAVSTPTAFGDAAATMVEGLNYASAALTAARVLTLPDSDDLDVGEFVKIKMAAGLSSTIYASIIIKVDSGDTIDGDASIRLESPYAAVSLYKVAANTWRIL